MAIANGAGSRPGDDLAPSLVNNWPPWRLTGYHNLHFKTLKTTNITDFDRAPPISMTSNQLTIFFLAVSWWTGHLEVFDDLEIFRRSVGDLGANWRWMAANWRRALAWCLIVVYHQLEVDRAAPLVAVVLDVLRPRLALDINKDTRCEVKIRLLGLKTILCLQA